MSERKVLFVCTANLCRSPTAEHLARQRATPDQYVFRSAGFLREGLPCPDRLIRLLDRRGIDLSGHRSHVLDRASIDEAHLIVTMEALHVREMASVSRPALPKTVPLGELVRFADAATWRELHERLAARDYSTYVGTRRTDDVPDPYGRRAGAYRSMIGRIDAMLAELFDRRAFKA